MTLDRCPPNSLRSAAMDLGTEGIALARPEPGRSERVITGAGTSRSIASLQRPRPSPIFDVALSAQLGVFATRARPVMRQDAQSPVQTEEIDAVQLESFDACRTRSPG